MRPDIIYSNSIIAVRVSKQMLNQARIKAMINASTAADAAKVLLECGYTLYENDDAIIADERAKTMQTFIELCPDDALLYCVKAKHDYHNAKVLVKKKSGKIDPNETLYPFAIQDLRGSFKNLEDKTDEQIETALYQDIAPYIQKIKSKTIKDYFRAEIDFLNMRTFAKCRLAKMSPAGLFVEGGTQTPSQIDKAAAEISDLSKFETDCNDFLIKKTEADKNDIFSSMILFNWFIMKQQEFKAVKAILMGKRFNFSKDQIRDSLRGLYEHFK